VVAAPRQSVGESVVAAAGARRQWRRRRQQSGGVQLGGGGGSLASALRRWRRHHRQSTKSVGGNGVGNGDDYSDNTERWRANAVVRIIVVAIGQRALEIGETTRSVEIFGKRGRGRPSQTPPGLGGRLRLHQVSSPLVSPL
jgi:hypothetical protein